MPLDFDQQISRLQTLYKQLTGMDWTWDGVPTAPLPATGSIEWLTHNLAHLESGLAMLMARAPAAAPSPGAMPAGARPPPVRIWESVTAWACELEVPGTSKPELSVELTDGGVKVRSQLPVPLKSPIDQGRLLYSDAPVGAFERWVPLPRHADEKTLEARFENGVLQIQCRKRGARSASDSRIEVA